MIRELKTWVWECSRCRFRSKPLPNVKEPTTPPHGWRRTLERHCDEHYCTGMEHVDLCPSCVRKEEAKNPDDD
jgi:hypothetical protein